MMNVKITIDAVCDKNGTPIMVGDTVKSVTSSFKIRIYDYIDFIKQLGAYEKEHGVPFCDSLIVVNPEE